MMNYYVYLALARGRSDALLRQAEDARRAEHARRYRQRAAARTEPWSGRSRWRPASSPATACLPRSPDEASMARGEAAEIPLSTVGYPPG